MELDRKAIGRRIRALRKRMKQSQKQFGQEIGVANTVVSAYENGDALPSVESLCKIATWGNVSTDWILAGFEALPDQQNITDQEAHLVQLFRLADDDSRETIMRVASMALKKG